VDIKTVLAFKGNSVFSVRPDSRLSEAVKLLHEKGIGAVFVMEDQEGKILGVLSERDVIRVIAEQGMEALQDVVANAMTRAVVACTSDTSVDSVIEGMGKFKVRHLPVFEGDQLVGMVSARDLMHYRIKELKSGEEPRFGHWFSKGKVFPLGE
jgi:CBS domain-containing protein